MIYTKSQLDNKKQNLLDLYNYLDSQISKIEIRKQKIQDKINNLDKSLIDEESYKLYPDLRVSNGCIYINSKYINTKSKIDYKIRYAYYSGYRLYVTVYNLHKRRKYIILAKELPISGPSSTSLNINLKDLKNLGILDEMLNKHKIKLKKEIVNYLNKNKNYTISKSSYLYDEISTLLLLK